MMPVSLPEVLGISAVLFILGLISVMTRRNAIGILMGVELILNSANLNFIAFARFHNVDVTGHVFVLFIILLAAVEAAIFLALCLAIYRHVHDIRADNLHELKG